MKCGCSSSAKSDKESTQDDQNVNSHQTNEEQKEQKEKVNFREIEREDKFEYKGFDLPKVIDAEPIRNLMITKNIRKVYKEGSFIRNLYLNVFDKDFLAYPHVLSSRHDFKALIKQQEVINKYFKGLVLREPDKNFKGFGFDSLWFLSKTEIINIFETIGYTMAHDISDFPPDGNEHHDPLFRPKNHPSVTNENMRQILSLMFCNVALCAANMSDNERLRERFWLLLNSKPDLKIGFAWTEEGSKPGGNLCFDWGTQAVLSIDGKHWIISGEKTKIMRDNYDYYLIFCRTKDYPVDRRPSFLLKEDIPYSGMVGIMVPKELLVIEDYEENGMPLQKIKILDVMVSAEEHEVVGADVDGVRCQNIRGLAQLGLSALITGQMKASLEKVYKYLVTDKMGIIQCEMISHTLAKMTEMLYSVESALYLSAAMFDSFETSAHAEMSLEAFLTSIMAVDYGHEFFDHIQKLYGTRHTVFSPFHDMIHFYDSLLETSFNNRMHVALCGLELLMDKKGDYMGRMARSPNEPGRSEMGTKLGFKRNRVFAPDYASFLDLQGYVHPTLKEAAIDIEQVVLGLAYASEIYITRHQKIDNKKHVELQMLSQLTLETFRLTCILGRASRSFSETLRNGAIDVKLALMVATEIKEKNWRMIEHFEVLSGDFDTGFNNQYLRDSKDVGHLIELDVLDIFTKDEWEKNFKPRSLKHHEGALDAARGNLLGI